MLSVTSSSSHLHVRELNYGQRNLTATELHRLLVALPDEMPHCVYVRLSSNPLQGAASDIAALLRKCSSTHVLSIVDIAVRCTCSDSAADASLCPWTLLADAIVQCAAIRSLSIGGNGLLASVAGARHVARIVALSFGLRVLELVPAAEPTDVAGLALIRDAWRSDSVTLLDLHWRHGPAQLASDEQLRPLVRDFAALRTRNSSQDVWAVRQNQLVRITMALESSFPPYVILAIVDQMPHFAPYEHAQKISVILRVVAHIHRLRAERAAPVAASNKG